MHRAKMAKTVTSLESFLNNITEKRTNEGPSLLHYDFNKSRCRVLSKSDEVKEDSSGVLYWMCRDSRVEDNWAFIFAQRLALKQKLPFLVCFFCKDCEGLYPTRRQFKFLIDGLTSVKQECTKLNIPFYLINQSPISLLNIVKNSNIGCVVTDFFPLKQVEEWKKQILGELPEDVSLVEVDAHNIVPVWLASNKQEIAARTLRPKITKKLDEYLTEFPALVKHPHSGNLTLKDIIEDFESVINNFQHNEVKEVDWAIPGPQEALSTLYTFLSKKLKDYGICSNDPSKDAQSNLSPWLHFGQISAQRCALEVELFKKQYPEQSAKFLEELVIRKELSDNFCHYNANYDNFEGADSWAKKTLNEHRKDKRTFLYNKEQFAKAETHDSIWNCCQLQLNQQGKLHGYMRMYWCKKILEWCESPEKALEIALWLNDTYSLDGSDPNGFTGVMWSICGIHDHGWKERDIFGKIRFMVDYSLRKKFDIDTYCSQFQTKEDPTTKSVTKNKRRKLLKN